MTELALCFELFRCATLPPEEAVARWGRLLKVVPFLTFGHRARRLLPAVWKNLQSLDKSWEERAAVETAYNEALARNICLGHTCLRVVALLEANGVQVIVLKGLILGICIHDDLGVRPTHDFDLLVPWNQAVEARRVLMQAGWQSLGQWHEPRERLQNAMDFALEGAKLDLHWHLLSEARQEWSDDELWSRRVPADLLGQTVHALCPTHQLFHLLAVAYREPHHLARYLYDIEIFLRRSQPEVDFEEIERMLASRHLLSRVHRLPLERLGWKPIRRQRGPSLFDVAWSTVTRHRHDFWGEWSYAFFPLLDYWLHFRGQRAPHWKLTTYLRKRLQVKSRQDLARRLRHKLARLLGFGAHLKA